MDHSGSNTCWYCTIWIAPARDFATMVATHQGGAAAETSCELATQELIKYVTFLGPQGARRR